MDTINTPEKILKTILGYHKFWNKQKPIINSIINGKNTLVFMPAKTGKSLCYQISALCLDGTAIVVLPLISSIEDQVNKLKDLGIKAEYLNSMLNNQQISQILKKYHKVH